MIPDTSYIVLVWWYNIDSFRECKQKRLPRLVSVAKLTIEENLYNCRAKTFDMYITNIALIQRKWERFYNRTLFSVLKKCIISSLGGSLNCGSKIALFWFANCRMFLVLIVIFLLWTFLCFSLGTFFDGYSRCFLAIDCVHILYIGLIQTYLSILSPFLAF